MSEPSKPAKSSAGPMMRTVAAAIRDAETLPRDKIAIQLVRRYAQLLDQARNTPDEPDVYADLGPKLLAALTALGMTRSGRSTVKGGGKSDAGTAGPAAAPPPSTFRQLRDAEAAGRERRTR